MLSRAGLVLCGTVLLALFAYALSGPLVHCGACRLQDLDLVARSADPEIVDLDGETFVRADRSVKLIEKFQAEGYTLESVRDLGTTVPRIVPVTLPSDLPDIRQADKRKDVFLTTVLPVILHENERLLLDRERLATLRVKLTFNRLLTADELSWLVDTYKRYDVEPGDMEMLMRRVDAVPVSLALAQAAAESGWGTSRFAQEGNALFGQWTFKAGKDGIVPSRRKAGKNHRIRAFDTLSDAVRAYMHNLNTHRAYREFRRNRAAYRLEGKPLDGYSLAAWLKRYSERGSDYIRDLRSIINGNDLERFDGATLASQRMAQRLPVEETPSG
jgi:Bax protein